MSEASVTDGLELVWIEPESAQDNPLQWKTHPDSQIKALDELIFGKEGVGWAGVVLINDRQVEHGWTEEEAIPTYLDGHARATLGRGKNQEIPALVGRWSPRAEKLILATIDPIAMLAQYDGDAFQRLRDSIGDTNSAVLESLLDDTAALSGVFDHMSSDRDRLNELYGEPEDRDSWPIIRARVPHHIYVLWDQIRTENQLDDDKTLMKVIEEAARTLLS